MSASSDRSEWNLMISKGISNINFPMIFFSSLWVLQPLWLLPSLVFFAKPARYASHVRVLGRWMDENFDDERSRHGYLVKVAPGQRGESKNLHSQNLTSILDTQNDGFLDVSPFKAILGMLDFWGVRFRVQTS